MRGRSSPSGTIRLCRIRKGACFADFRARFRRAFLFSATSDFWLQSPHSEFPNARTPCRISTAVNKAIWMLSAAVALTAGITDLRWRRIPNWLTVPAIPGAIALHTIAAGWPGARLSLLGAALGLGLMLPLVLIRS